MMTNAIGVAASNVTVGPSNDTHLQVAIDLGTATNGKRREFQGLRIVSGFEKELIVNQTRVGEVYMFVFLKTVEGSSSVTLLLN